jgi:hypothetical protein
MVIWVLIWISANFTNKFLFGFSMGAVVVWFFILIWFKVDLTTLVSINSKESISLTIVNCSSVWAIDWNLGIVASKSVPVGVWIGEKPTLKHLVIGWLNTWNKMRW